MIYFILAILFSLNVQAQTYIQGNNLVEVPNTVATAGATTTLTSASQTNQIFTGSLNQTVVLPNATTLQVGRRFYVQNSSTGTITLQFNGGGAATTLPSGAQSTCIVTANGTSAGTWSVSKITSIFTGQILAADGSSGAPSYSYSAETNSGYYRAGTGDLVLMVNGAQGVEYIKSGSNVNVGYGPSGTVSSAPSNPASFYSSYNGEQFFQYGNTNTGTASSSAFQILSGTPSANNATEIGNAAYTVSGGVGTYLAGGSWLSGTLFQSQLNIMSESATGSIRFNVGGRTLLTEQMRLNTTDLTLNNGNPLIMNGSSSGAVSIKTQASAGTYNFNLPITAGTSGYGLTSAGGGSSAMTWTNFQAAGNYITALTGDVTASGPGSVAATLAATSNATLTTLSGLTTASSLASVGTITSGTWHGTAVGSQYGGTGLDTSAATGVPSVTSGTWSTAAALAASKGGTGISTSASTGYPSIASGTWSVATAAATFTTLFETVATTGGDLVYGAASGAPTRLANGSSGQLLQSAGGTSAPTWATLTAPTKQIFTSGSSATYTTPAGAKFLKVTLIGGGGAGGGAAATSGNGAAGGGGGGGGAVIAYIASPSGTYTYTVGAGGTVGTAGNNAGNNGANTTFSTYTAGGGGGGGGSAASVTGATNVGSKGTAGTASGGNLNIPGMTGGTGWLLNTTQVFSGAGGNSILGFGGSQVAFGSSGAGFSGIVGAAYGGGGSGGGSAGTNTTAQTGGAGADGVIVVEEFYQ